MCRSHFQDPRWCPLLSSKYTKLRPALLLSMVLENDSKPSEPSPDRFKARKAPPRQGLFHNWRLFSLYLLFNLSKNIFELGLSHHSKDVVVVVVVVIYPAYPHSSFSVSFLNSSAFVGSPAVIELLPEKLEAVLIPDQGYHQIGPADHCSDMFLLSVTLAFAAKLEQVGTTCLTFNQLLLHCAFQTIK